MSGEAYNAGIGLHHGLLPFLALLLSLVDTHGAGGEWGGAALGAQVDIVDDLNHN